MTRRSRNIRPRLLLVVTLLAAAARAWAADEAKPAPEPRKPLQIQSAYVDAPPVIDGKLDDACWAKAARLEGFFVPNLTQAVPEETIGLICVDNTTIYVGIICKDRTPDDIKGVETRRNGEIWQDDFVEFGLDPGHSHQDSYCFEVTARGTQCEEIPGGSATKIEWRGDWSAAATRTPEGYQVEMAIPFSILRYPPGQNTFGFTLYRRFAREQVGVLYPDMGKTEDPNLAADLVGLHPPTFAPRPIFMPYVTMDLGASAKRRFGSGMDVQYKLPSGLTTLGTYRPDYLQIEQAVEPISFSYTERYLPEVRPFFMTGAGGFFPGSEAFYSRRIQNFDTGVKLFGSLGKERIGLLDALRYGEENSLVARWQHFTTPDASAGLWLVHHHQVGEPDNLVYALDGGRTWRCPEGSDSLWTRTLQSVGEGADGAVYQMGGDHWRGVGKLRYDWSARYAIADYHPALGYWYDQDTYGGSFNVGKNYHYEKGGIQDRFWYLVGDYYPYRHERGIYQGVFGAVYTWVWRNGRYIGIGTGDGRERNQPSTYLNTSIGWNGKDLYRQGSLFALRSARAGGDYTYFRLQQGFRPRRGLSVSLAFEYAHLTPPSPDAYHAYQTVFTTSYDLTPEKSIAARLVARDAGVTLYAAYRQVVRRGMDAYIIVGDPDPSRTGFQQRVAAKVVRVF